MTITEEVDKILKDIEDENKDRISKSMKGLISYSQQEKLQILIATAKGLLLGLDEIEKMIAKELMGWKGYNDTVAYAFDQFKEEITLAQKRLREVVGK